MTHITLMRGIPGSGKSSIAMKLDGDVAVCSTDDFWYLHTGGTYYAFDIKQIAEAHLWNQRRVEDCIKAKPPYAGVIIDNTNITSHAVAPYFDLAVKYNCSISILTVDTPLEECIKRNALRSEDRQVPESAIRRMHEQMKEMSADRELAAAKRRVK